MMQGDHIEHFLEDSPRRDSKLHEVFNKISDIWQQQHTVSNRQKMSSEIIETILPERNSIPISGNGYQGVDESEEDCGDSAAVQALARRLEDVLRAAKSAQLECGGVLLPADLLPRIARDVLRMAENEPCGLKGCKLYINFEMEQECRRLSSIKCDKNTVSTFELFLTLKQDASSWHSILPQFLKNLAKPRTIVISPGFTLEKKKLYRSYME